MQSLVVENGVNDGKKAADLSNHSLSVCETPVCGGRKLSQMWTLCIHTCPVERVITLRLCKRYLLFGKSHMFRDAHVTQKAYMYRKCSSFTNRITIVNANMVLLLYRLTQ